MVRLTVDLQDDFALNQPLSPLALAAIELLDRESPEYPLDVLSVIEATLDDPRQVLAAQLFKARGEAVAAMKADGIEYDERMELLEAVTYPQPLADLLEAAYDIYRQGHPWVADHELAPKSVARDMYERAMTFTEYVGFYGLARCEGLVLRYLADAYKALRQTVPEEARTEELDRPDRVARRAGPPGRLQPDRRVGAAAQPGGRGRCAVVDDRPPAVTGNQRAFRVLVRNALFRRVELAALRRYDELGALDAEAGWDAEAWAEALEPYFAEHDEIGTGPDARGPALLIIDRAAGTAGWCGRSSTTRPATTTGASARRSTWPPRTRPGSAVQRVTSVGQL